MNTKLLIQNSLCIPILCSNAILMLTTWNISVFRYSKTQIIHWYATNTLLSGLFCCCLYTCMRQSAWLAITSPCWVWLAGSSKGGAGGVSPAGCWVMGVAVSPACCGVPVCVTSPARCWATAGCSMGSSSLVLVAGPAPPSLGASSIAWALVVRFLARLGRATPVVVIDTITTTGVARLWRRPWRQLSLLFAVLASVTTMCTLINITTKIHYYGMGLMDERCST